METRLPRGEVWPIATSRCDRLLALAVSELIRTGRFFSVEAQPTLGEVLARIGIRVPSRPGPARQMQADATATLDNETDSRLP